MKIAYIPATVVGFAVLAVGGFAIGQSFTTTGVGRGGPSFTCSPGYVPAPNGQAACIPQSNSGLVTITTGSYTIGQNIIIGTAAIPQLPVGAVFHQVVDRFYDRDGNVVKTASMTHAVGYDCNPGLRRQDQELMVQDDGKGNVTFASPYLASEPREGVRPVTKEGIVKAQLAMARSPAIAAAPAIAATAPTKVAAVPVSVISEGWQ